MGLNGPYGKGEEPQGVAAPHGLVQIGFEPQLHRNMEAYMDDIVVKTKDGATFVQDLEETFANLRKMGRWKRCGEQRRLAALNRGSSDGEDISMTVDTSSGVRRKAALRDPGFAKEAFDAFNSADAYIRAARDGLARATEQHLKDMRVSVD